MKSKEGSIRRKPLEPISYKLDDLIDFDKEFNPVMFQELKDGKWVDWK